MAQRFITLPNTGRSQIPRSLALRQEVDAARAARCSGVSGRSLLGGLCRVAVGAHGVHAGGQFLCVQEAVRCFRRQGFDPKRSRALGRIIFVTLIFSSCKQLITINMPTEKDEALLNVWGNFRLRSNEIASLVLTGAADLPTDYS